MQSPISKLATQARIFPDVELVKEAKKLVNIKTNSPNLAVNGLTQVDLGFLPFTRDDSAIIEKWLKSIHNINLDNREDLQTCANIIGSTYKLCQAGASPLAPCLDDLVYEISNNPSKKNILELLFRSGLKNHRTIKNEYEYEYEYDDPETPIYCEFLKLALGQKHFNDNTESLDYQGFIKTELKRLTTYIANDVFSEFSVFLTSVNKQGNLELKDFNDLPIKQLKKPYQIYFRPKDEAGVVRKLTKEAEANLNTAVRDHGALTLVFPSDFFKNTKKLKTACDILEKALKTYNSNFEITIKQITKNGHPMKGKVFFKIYDPVAKIGYEIQLLDSNCLIASKKLISAHPIYKHYKEKIETAFERSGYVNSDTFEQAVREASEEPVAKEYGHNFDAIKEDWIQRSGAIFSEKYGYINPRAIKRLYLDGKINNTLSTLSDDFFLDFMKHYLIAIQFEYKNKVLNILQEDNKNAVNQIWKSVASVLAGTDTTDNLFETVEEIEKTLTKPPEASSLTNPSVPKHLPSDQRFLNSSG